MIRIVLGNVGSGKTAMEVREMFHNPTGRVIYTNIIPKNKKFLPHVKVLNYGMIVKKEVIDTKRKKDGTLENVEKLTLNVDFWKEESKKHPISVVLDEAHAILNARTPMSKTNKIVTQWIALIRRVLGQSESGSGELVLITQLERRLDVIARDMATQVRYNICHYMKSCRACGYRWSESSENPEPQHKCLRCNSPRVFKHSHKIETWHYANMQAYMTHKEFGMTTHYRHYLTTDIEDYFPLYDTLQWENLITDY